MERVKNYLFRDTIKQLVKEMIKEEKKKISDKLEKIEKPFLELMDYLDKSEKVVEERIKNLNIAIDELRELYETIENLNLKNIKTGLDVVKVNSRIH